MPADLDKAEREAVPIPTADVALPAEQLLGAREPKEDEVWSVILGYGRRIGYPRLQVGDIIIEAGRGWGGFVYSPNVTRQQRLQVYHYVLATPDADDSVV